MRNTRTGYILVMDTANEKYEPDFYDFLVNFLWNIIWFGVALGGLLCLFGEKKIDLDFLSTLSFTLTAWIGIFSAHISIRRFDKKYMDRILSDPRSGLFMAFILSPFSPGNTVKCRWLRSLVYFPSFKRSKTKATLRKELIPEFDYYRDVKFFDKFLFYGQLIAIVVFGILAAF